MTNVSFLGPAAPLLMDCAGTLPICRWILGDLEEIADDDGNVRADRGALAHALGVDAGLLSEALDQLEERGLVRVAGLEIHLVSDGDVECAMQPRDTPRDARAEVCAVPSAVRAVDRATAPLTTTTLEKEESPSKEVVVSSSAVEVFWKDVWRAFYKATGKDRGFKDAEKEALARAFECGAAAGDYQLAIDIVQARGRRSLASVKYLHGLAFEIVQHCQAGGSYESFARDHESEEVCARLGFKPESLCAWMSDPTAYEDQGPAPPRERPQSALWEDFRAALGAELDEQALAASIDLLEVVEDQDRLVLRPAAGTDWNCRWEMPFLRARDSLGIELEILDAAVAA